MHTSESSLEMSDIPLNPGFDGEPKTILRNLSDWFVSCVLFIYKSFSSPCFFFLIIGMQSL
jgi:hypothetical protein